MTEPESVRWVRYAADCAERVLPLTGQARPQAEAAIASARAWADHPCEEHQRAAIAAAGAVGTAGAATWAAAGAAGAAYVADAATWDASDAAGAVARVAYAAAGAAWVVYATARAAFMANGDAAYDAERAWQAERRKHYGLPGGKA